MPKLYVLATVDGSGNIISFIRKGRNNAISGYDDLASAKRGLAQSRGLFARYLPTVKVRIVEASSLSVIHTEEVPDN
jgi:hypothetical protein